MEGQAKNGPGFTSLWYQLRWAIDDLEDSDDPRWHYDGSQQMKLLLGKALSRLEFAMDENTVKEFRRKYRVKAAGARWMELREKLEKLEKSRTVDEPHISSVAAPRLDAPESEIAKLKQEVGALEEELGDEEIARLRDWARLPIGFCGTPALMSMSWTPEKQRKSDEKLLQEVEGFLGRRSDSP